MSVVIGDFLIKNNKGWEILNDTKKMFVQLPKISNHISYQKLTETLTVLLYTETNNLRSSDKSEKSQNSQR